MGEEMYLINEETGERFRLGGFIPSPEESDLPKFSASRKYSNGQLPEGVDLRQLMTPVEHQGTLNSCVGNALAGAYEFLIMKSKKKQVGVSRLFIYYNSRRKDGLQEYNMQDQGTFIRSAIAALAEFGCCKEELYPYDPKNVNRPPPGHCYSEAKKYRVLQGIQVQTELNEMRACLAEGYPFAFGIQTFSSFGQSGSNGGVVPMPQPQEQQNNQHGWHAMLAVGYSDKQRSFIVRNSWGANWGDKGYLYIPYDYMSDRQRCQDLHTIKLISDDRSESVDHKRDEIPNPYHWNTHKNVQFFIPPNYHYPSFDNTWFWKQNQQLNYFNPQWMNVHFGSDLPMASNKKSPWVIRTNNQSNEDQQQQRAGEREDKVLILWVDESSAENTQLATKFLGEVKFLSTFAEGEEYLHREREKIRSSPSKFLLISRGFYKDEGKTALDLFQVLQREQLTNVPLLVFTGDKSRLVTRLTEQATTQRINDWKETLQIFDQTEQFLARVKHYTQH